MSDTKDPIVDAQVKALRAIRAKLAEDVPRRCGDGNDSYLAGVRAALQHACDVLTMRVAEILLETKNNPKSKLDLVDLDKLADDIKKIAVEGPAALAEFREASQSMVHDLCVLLGAGSYANGRERLVAILFREGFVPR